MHSWTGKRAGLHPGCQMSGIRHRDSKGCRWMLFPAVSCRPGTCSLGHCLPSNPCQDKPPRLLGATGSPGLPHRFAYSPVLAFMVAGMLCCEFMTADIPTPYSVPGTRSVSRRRNRRYSECVKVGRPREGKRMISDSCSALMFSPSRIPPDY